MNKTKSDVASVVALDSTIGTDGHSNYDRVVYVCTVFQMEYLDLECKFDFSSIIQCQEPDVVLASKHLAVLQLAYWNGMFNAGLVMEENHALSTAQLILDIQKITWHYDHLIEGKITPPYQFIH